jgi:hypothetical protein
MKWVLDGFQETLEVQWRAACIAAIGVEIAARFAHLLPRGGVPVVPGLARKLFFVRWNQQGQRSLFTPSCF